jgi:hypothetical protein
MRDGFPIVSVDAKSPLLQVTQLNHGVNTSQLCTGLLILVLGTIFYFFFRSAEHTYFLKFFGLNPYKIDYLPSAVVLIGNSLPTFIHVLAFSLITAGLIATRKRGYAFVCLAWFIIDVLFELAQAFGEVIIQVVPDRFSNFLFLENTKNYFLHGCFDYLDLLSIALGSVTAYIFLVLTIKGNGGEHE